MPPESRASGRGIRCPEGCTAFAPDPLPWAGEEIMLGNEQAAVGASMVCTVCIDILQHFWPRSRFWEPLRTSRQLHHHRRPTRPALLSSCAEAVQNLAAAAAASVPRVTAVKFSDNGLVSWLQERRCHVDSGGILGGVRRSVTPIRIVDATITQPAPASAADQPT